MARKGLIIILLLFLAGFIVSCGKKAENSIDITLGDYDRESAGRSDRGVVIEEISQNISYSEDSNVVMVYFFSNLSENENFNYLKEGLIDYIINISKAGQVEFVDTSTLWSKLRLKNITNPESLSIASVLRIAKELNVKYLITGNFRTFQDEIIISATLRRVDDGFILSESVQRGMFSKLFDIMNSLTDEIFADDKIGGSGDTTSQSSEIKVDTDNPEAYNHYLQGQYYISNFKNDKAYDELKKAVELDNKFGSAYIMLIALSVGKAREENISSAIENKLYFNRINQLLLEFVILDKKIYRDEALKLASKIDELNREIKEAEISYLLYTNLYMWTMDIKDQIEYLKDIIHQDPFYENAYNLLGYKFSEIEDYENALKYLNQYAILMPDSPNPHDSLGDLYRVMGNYELAEDEYKKALDIDKDFYFSYMNLLTLYEMDYRHNDAIEFTNSYFRRFVDENAVNIDKLISLSTAYLLFSYQSLELIDYRSLSSYILYLLRNGFIYDAMDLTERWQNLILSKGDLKKAFSEYSYDFVYYFGQPVLMKYYFEEDYEGYVAFLDNIMPFMQKRELILINYFLLVYFNEEEWFNRVINHFGLQDKDKIVVDTLCSNLYELYNKGEYKKASELYENIDTLQIRDPNTLLFFAMQIDIKIGITERVGWYDLQVKKIKNNAVHYNLFAGMLEELKGNYPESLKIYTQLDNYLKKNNEKNFKVIISDILDERINTVRSK